MMRQKRWMGLMLMLALAGGVLTGWGQQYKWHDLEATNNVPDNSTTTENLGPAINCTRYGEIALDIGFELMGSGPTACTFKFTRSVDGTNYTTTAPIEIAIAPNGTTAVRTNLTVSLGAVGYLKLSSIAAGNNGYAMTNIVVGYAFKPNRRE